MTKNECIKNGDYEYAMEKYESANKRWKSHWWDCLVKLYSSCKEFAEKYILNNAKMIVEKIADIVKTVVRKVRHSKYDDIITNYTSYDIKQKGGELCYLFEFYNDDNILLCSKVGTTTRTIKQRLSEELKSKTYKGMGATRATVNRVYDCGDLPAEGLESLIRSEYIKKYPRSFKKNDRFINEYFDFDECDKIAKNYLKMA